MVREREGAENIGTSSIGVRHNFREVGRRDKHQRQTLNEKLLEAQETESGSVDTPHPGSGCREEG